MYLQIHARRAIILECSENIHLTEGKKWQDLHW